MRYYDVHVFISRKNGYSVAVSIETEDELSEDEIIVEAVNQGVLDADDAVYVDNIDEMVETEWKEFFNKV